MNDEHDVWWKAYSGGQSAAALARAQDLIVRAERALRYEGLFIDGDAEALFRRSLAYLREASLWQPEKKYLRTYLHGIGRRIHDLFGCEFKFDSGGYSVSCPVQLSHSKGGFSIGGSGKVLCTICGKNILDCPHVKGRVYNQIVAERHHDICNICGYNRLEQKCEHIESETYDGVRAFGIVVEMDIDHVAYVQNPANPLAVITGYSLNEADALKRLPAKEQEHFKYGEARLYCHHCRLCTGSE